MQKRKKRIEMCLTDEEYEAIEKLANEMSLQVAPYCRMMALKGIIGLREGKSNE